MNVSMRPDVKPTRHVGLVQACRDLGVYSFEQALSQPYPVSMGLYLKRALSLGKGKPVLTYDPETDFFRPMDYYHELVKLPTIAETANHRLVATEWQGKLICHVIWKETGMAMPFFKEAS